MNKKLIPDALQPYFQRGEIYLRNWIVKRPRTALLLVIFCAVIVLPLVTSAALMPFVLLLDLSNFLVTKGAIYVVYLVLFQGFVLVALLVIIFFTVFAFATFFSVFHSYSFFYK